MAPRTMVVLAAVVVTAVAMTAAQLPQTAHALDLCSTTGSCVRVGDGKITFFPEAEPENEYFHLTLEVTSMQELNADGNAISGRTNSNFGSCTTGPTLVSEGGVFSVTQVTCPGVEVSGSAFVASVKVVLKDTTVTLKDRTVELKAGNVKIDYTFEWPNLCGTECLTHQFKFLVDGTWRIPTTWSEALDAGLNQEPQDISKLAVITNNARGNPGRVQVDAIFSVDMVIPDVARICSAEDAELAPLTCWRDFTSSASFSNQVKTAQVDVEVPQKVSIETSWTGVSTSMFVDPVFSVSKGQLATGDWDFQFLFNLGIAVIVILIVVCILFYCCVCPCCPLARCCTGARSRRKIAPNRHESDFSTGTDDAGGWAGSAGSLNSGSGRSNHDRGGSGRGGSGRGRGGDDDGGPSTHAAPAGWSQEQTRNPAPVQWQMHRTSSRRQNAVMSLEEDDDIEEIV